MEVTISYIETMEPVPAYEEIVNRVCAEVSRVYGIGNDEELSVLLCDNPYIHQLNKTYRNIDRPTDVLSFALNEGEDNGDLESHLIGDLIISLERTAEQAEEYGHPFERELAYLTVHGCLHILGYDHMTDEDKKEMRQEEEFVLGNLGYVRMHHIMNKDAHFKSGFVAVVGRPNVGKSTLINALIGDKIVIVSDKAQTTRNRIVCIYMDEKKQIVFMDTPGIHKPKHKLGEFMVKAAVDSLKEVEAVLFLVAANEKRGPGDNFIIEQLKNVNVPVFLVINKIDTLTKEEVLETIVEYKNLYPFEGIIPISAREKDNISEVLTVLEEVLPEGPQYFPDDMITDQPERLIIADIVREKILLKTREEIPHAIAVDVDEMKQRDDGTTYIRATIYCERDSQKGIIIGKKGSMLRELGGEARSDIERLLATKVYLDLWVKVKKDWRNKSGMLSEFGYE